MRIDFYGHLARIHMFFREARTMTQRHAKGRGAARALQVRSDDDQRSLKLGCRLAFDIGPIRVSRADGGLLVFQEHTVCAVG